MSSRPISKPTRPASSRGASNTALALQTSLGFALTLAPIWGLPYLAAETGWRFAFLVLAPGPVLGCLAMAALRRRPEALKLAAGKR